MSSNEPRAVDRLLAVMYEADTLVRVDLAEAIVGEGWRPPRRRVETAEELNALPAGTVIRDADGVFLCHDPYDTGCGTWFPAWLVGRAYECDFGMAPALDASIIWEPEEAACE